MPNQPAAEHYIHEVRALRRAIGKVRTARDDLRRRCLTVAGVNTEHHRVIVSVLFLIEVSNVTQYADHSVLEAVSFVGTNPFFRPALALEQGSFLNRLRGDGLKAGHGEEANFSTSAFGPLGSRQNADLLVRQFDEADVLHLVRSHQEEL